MKFGNRIRFLFVLMDRNVRLSNKICKMYEWNAEVKWMWAIGYDHLGYLSCMIKEALKLWPK